MKKVILLSCLFLLASLLSFGQNTTFQYNNNGGYRIKYTMKVGVDTAKILAPEKDGFLYVQLNDSLAVNVTSITGSQSGNELAFLFDATGASRKVKFIGTYLKGNTLTYTILQNKRGIYIFRNVNGVYYLVSASTES